MRRAQWFFTNLPIVVKRVFGGGGGECPGWDYIGGLVEQVRYEGRGSSIVFVGGFVSEVG